ncbi:MAG: hypothetical protein WB392_11015 [Methanotrichaceae archaeon]
MIKLLCLSALLLSLLMGSAASQLWDLGSPQDWLSSGPVYVTGPYYTPIGILPSSTYTYPNVSQSYGFQKFFSIDYSQFYRMPIGAAPITHITAPQRYAISGNVPVSLYFTGQTQAVPYSQYQTYATYTGSNSLWIEGTTSWTQYATVPQGSSLTLLVITPTGGSGYLYEIRPDGQLMKNYYYFYPGSSQISFYADTIGQHILLFSIGSQLSNAVDIDVTGYSPPSNQQTVYQQPNYNQPAPQQSSSQPISNPSTGGY